MPGNVTVVHERIACARARHFTWWCWWASAFCSDWLTLSRHLSGPKASCSGRVAAGVLVRRGVNMFGLWHSMHALSKVLP
jgi:hypothetical protein